MAIDLERELRAAFEIEAGDPAPRSDLADRVRHRVARRRLIVGITAALLVIGSTVTAAVTTHPHHEAPLSGITTDNGKRLVLPIADVDDLALDGTTLYVTSGDVPDAVLAAYDTQTGDLLRRVRLPALPASLRIGPSGEVWVNFYPSSAGGRSGIWELSADLSIRYQVDLHDARYRRAAVFDVLPTGPRSILVAADQGFASIHVPALGRHGASTIRWRTLNHGSQQLFTTGLDRLSDGSVLVAFSGDGGASELVRADGSARINPGHGAELAASPEGLWVANAGAGHSLRLLDNELRPLPFSDPREVSGIVADLWASASTVWVSSDAASDRLVCFSYQGIGHVATATAQIGIAGQPSSLISNESTVYVATDSGVRSYPIPVPCQV